MTEPSARLRPDPAASLLGEPFQLLDDDPGRLVIAAFVPPEALLDPPAVFPLVVKQNAAAAAYVVFQFDLGLLLHVLLDCPGSPVVPASRHFGMNFRATPFIQ